MSANEDLQTTPAELDATIAAALQCLASSERAISPELIMKLEAAQPANAAQWEAVDKIFTSAGRSAWCEVMVTRFLRVEPGSHQALLREISLLSRHRRAEAQAKVARLDPSVLLKVSDLLNFGTVCFECDLKDLGTTSFRRAVAMNPESTQIRITVIHQFITAGLLTEAGKELPALAALAENDSQKLIPVANLAIRLGDLAQAREVLWTSLHKADAGDQVIRLRIVPLAFKLEDKDLATEALRLLNVSSVTDVKQLEVIYIAMQGRGFVLAEYAVVDRILRLQPGNATALAARHGHHQPIYRWLVGPGHGAGARLVSPCANGSVPDRTVGRARRWWVRLFRDGGSS